MSCHVVCTYRIISHLSYLIIPCRELYVTACRLISYHIISYHIISYPTLSYHVVPDPYICGFYHNFTIYNFNNTLNSEIIVCEMIIRSYIYIYICIYTHVYLHLYLSLYLSVSLSLYIYMCIYIYIHVYIHTYVHVYMSPRAVEGRRRHALRQAEPGLPGGNILRY